MKLDTLKFGLAGGIISALFAFVLALGSAFAGWGTGLVDSLASMYIGYKAGFVGGLIGALWAFVEGFISFYLLAWVYDYLQKEKSA
jgi:nitrate/nitrite transporter NarK